MIGEVVRTGDDVVESVIILIYYWREMLTLLNQYQNQVNR